MKLRIDELGGSIQRAKSALQDRHKLTAQAEGDLKELKHERDELIAELRETE